MNYCLQVTPKVINNYKSDSEEEDESDEEDDYVPVKRSAAKAPIVPTPKPKPVSKPVPKPVSKPKPAAPKLTAVSNKTKKANSYGSDSDDDDDDLDDDDLPPKKPLPPVKSRPKPPIKPATPKNETKPVVVVNRSAEKLSEPKEKMCKILLCFFFKIFWSGNFLINHFFCIYLLIKFEKVSND